MVDPATAAMIGAKTVGSGLGLLKELAGGDRLQKAQKQSLLDRNKMARLSPQNLGITDKQQRLSKGKEEIGAGINAQVKEMARQKLAARGAGQNRGADSRQIEAVATGAGKAVADLSGQLEAADVQAEKADVAALDSAMARQQQIDAKQNAVEQGLLQKGFADLGQAGAKGVLLREGKGAVEIAKAELA